MKRREFIALLSGVAAQPFHARAQQATLPVIGYLSSRSLKNSKDIVAAFHQGLSEKGYVEGEERSHSISLCGRSPRWTVIVSFRFGSAQCERNRCNRRYIFRPCGQANNDVNSDRFCYGW